MTAKEVKQILGITQNTINNYIKKGILRYTKINDYHYIYNDDDVYSLLGQKPKNNRINITYSRVSLSKLKNDLISQQQRLYDFSSMNGYRLDMELSDVKSGMSFDRKDFNKLYNLVIEGKVNYVIIENKDRLCRFGFELLEKLFNSFGTNIIVVNNINNKTYEQELTDDLLYIVNQFSNESIDGRKFNQLKKELSEGTEVNI